MHVVDGCACAHVWICRWKRAKISACAFEGPPEGPLRDMRDDEMHVRGQIYITSYIYVHVRGCQMHGPVDLCTCARRMFMHPGSVSQGVELLHVLAAVTHVVLLVSKAHNVG